eukprot:6197931-Pleurochrysis_carterae.AAC.1
MSSPFFSPTPFVSAVSVAFFSGGASQHDRDAASRGRAARAAVSRARRRDGAAFEAARTSITSNPACRSERAKAADQKGRILPWAKRSWRSGESEAEGKRANGMESVRERGRDWGCDIVCVCTRQ